MSVRLTALLLTLCASASIAQDKPEPAIQVEQVAPGIHVLYGQAGNIGVSSGADGVFLIDDQYAAMTPKVLRRLPESIRRAPVRLNTHWHTVTLVVTRISRGKDRSSSLRPGAGAHGSEQFSEFFQRKTRLSGKGPARRTFNDSVSLHLRRRTARHPCTAGPHRRGCIHPLSQSQRDPHRRSHVRGMYPFIDLESGDQSTEHCRGGQDAGARGRQTRIIPGHGKVTIGGTRGLPGDACDN